MVYGSMGTKAEGDKVNNKIVKFFIWQKLALIASILEEGQVINSQNCIHF